MNENNDRENQQEETTESIEQEAGESLAQKPQMITISEVEYESLKSEAQEYKNKYLRALAEQENARKRLQKEREQLTQYAVQNAIVDFLSPLDHFENALKFTEQMSDEVKHWGLGFQMILSQFKEVLSRNGIEPIESVGKQMDPHLHEVIEAIPSANHRPGTIIEESMRGYRMGNTTIRPARVKVAKAPQQDKE